MFLDTDCGEALGLLVTDPPPRLSCFRLGLQERGEALAHPLEGLINSLLALAWGMEKQELQKCGAFMLLPWYHTHVCWLRLANFSMPTTPFLEFGLTRSKQKETPFFFSGAPDD